MCSIAAAEQEAISDAIEGWAMSPSEREDDYLAQILKENPDMAQRMMELAEREKDIVAKQNIESTHKHCFDLAILAKSLAESGDIKELAKPSPQGKKIFVMSALFHDIGKKEIDPELLTKPGHLTDGEYEIFKGHPQAGYELCLNNLSNPAEAAIVAETVLRHHTYKQKQPYPPQSELHRFDEPETEEMIHNYSKILAVIDAFDSLRSARSYRGAAPREDVIGMLEADFPDQKELINFLVVNFIPPAELEKEKE
ncbi:MAG: HD domain-containing protein [Patescibacteria group bacterium]|jgi:HD-GYP domain-containing protein (c-di-GMP phosphodiesterase class II)